MRTSEVTETQIILILKQADARVPVKDIFRQAGIRYDDVLPLEEQVRGA